MPGVSRGKVFFAIFVALGLLFGWSVYNDLRMPEVQDRKDGNARSSSITVEKLRLDRDISGDIWSLDSERAEKFDGEILASRVTLMFSRKDGQVWETTSPTAIFLEKEGTVTLDLPRGTGKGDTFQLEWQAPKAILNEKTGEVLFPEGIRMSSDKADIVASWGKIFNDGSMILENGAEVNWIIQE